LPPLLVCAKGLAEDFLQLADIQETFMSGRFTPSSSITTPALSTAPGRPGAGSARRRSLRAFAVGLPLRAASIAVALGLAGAAFSPAAQAQADYPNRTIRFVVTFPSGGAPDTLARIFAEKAQMGQPVVVDNKPGAGGNIGSEMVAKAPADGYTLLLGTVGTHAINGALYPKLPYDPVHDFSPITLLALTPNLLVINKDLPVQSVKDLIDYGKKNPGSLSFGSSGIGTSIHLSGELFKIMTGVQMTHIPYKGRQMAIPDLLGGQIQMIFDNMPSALPLVKEGKLRALGVTTATRSPAAPEIPTIAESGVPGFEATSWFAVYTTAKVPAPIIDKLNKEFRRVFALPDVQERLKTNGLEPKLGSPEDLARFQAGETAKRTKVVKESGAKVE